MQVNTEIPYEFKEFVKDCFAGGSRVICNPPVTDTDLDICVLLHDKADLGTLEGLGYVPCPLHYDVMMGAEYAFCTFRKDEINLIVTCDDALFERYRLATEWATKINIQNKEDRAMFFMLVKYGDRTNVTAKMNPQSNFPFV